MASVNVKLPEEFFKRISELGDKTDAIVTKALEAGGEIVVRQVRSNLKAMIGKNLKYKGRSTGELVAALGVSAVRLDRKGDHNIKVGFDEPRQDGESNAKLATIIEFGKHGQPAKPFLKPAKTTSRKACMEAMKQTLEQEMIKK